MNREILDFYKKISMYTNYQPYEKYFKELPDDLDKLMNLIRSNIIHRVELMKDNEKGEQLRMAFPWYRYRCEDDVLLTAPAMMAELFRQDERGLVLDREVADKIVVTCRYMSVLAASILKAKGYSCRLRSGFAPYFYDDIACDHWICQYYDEKTERWIDYDVDALLRDDKKKKMIFASLAWLDVRSGKRDISYFVHGSGIRGLAMLARAVFFDFHSLMNDEISYLFMPTYIDEEEEFFSLTTDDLKEIDDLAQLLLEPDKNFDEIRYLFRSDPKLRVINTPLVGDRNHLELEDIGDL